MPYIPKILDILTWPDPQLKLKSKPITEFNEDLEHFVADMFLTMRTLEGIGLAAPQVNRQERIIILQLEDNIPLIIINPKIIKESDELFKWEEGCLSVPGYYKKRKRPENVVIKFQDIEGEFHEMEMFGLYSFAIQHEIDHLDGICFVDNISRVWYPNVRKAIKKELPKFTKKVDLARQKQNEIK